MQEQQQEQVAEPESTLDDGGGLHFGANVLDSRSLLVHLRLRFVANWQQRDSACLAPGPLGFGLCLHGSKPTQAIRRARERGKSNRTCPKKKTKTKTKTSEVKKCTKQ